MSEKYRFSVISFKDREGILHFDVRCLHCMYLFKPLCEKYMNKVVSRIVLPISDSVSKMLKDELTPAQLLPGMKGGPYNPTFETLPCSTKDTLVSLLLSDHKEKLDHFKNCAEKKCIKFTDTWKMYNLYYQGKLLSRIYRKDVYSADFIRDEIKKILGNYNKFYEKIFDIKSITIKTESRQDITEHFFPNLFLSSDLDFLNEYKI